MKLLRKGDYRTLLFILLVVGMRIASAPTGLAAFLMLAGYAFLGPRQVIHALLLCWLFMMLNVEIVPRVPASNLLRYVVVVASATSVLMRAGPKIGSGISQFSAATIGLSLFICLHSLIVSAEPFISILKAINWSLAMLTSVAAWKNMTVETRKQTTEFVYHVLVGVLFLSFLYLGNPLAYMKEGASLFRGVLGQSQALGPAMALLVVWSASRLVVKPTYSGILICVAALYAVYLTNSRTALFAAIIGLFTALVLHSILGNRQNQILKALRSSKFGISLVFVVLGLVYIAPDLGTLTENFLRKGTQSDSLIDAYGASRGGLVANMNENIKQYPFSGIGFGIASDPENMEVQRLYDIPISAIVEKGVMPIAVVEELGIPGALLVLGWLILMLRKCMSDAPEPLALILTVLALNMGESTLFSAGGMGMLPIVLIGLATSIRTSKN